MACEVTYKGTKYSRNEFIELLYNGELDKLMPKLDQRYFVGTYAPEVKKYNPLQDVESTAKALETKSKKSNFVLNIDKTKTYQNIDYGGITWQNSNLSSFNKGEDGKTYVTDKDGNIYEIKKTKLSANNTFLVQIKDNKGNKIGVFEFKKDKDDKFFSEESYTSKKGKGIASIAYDYASKDGELIKPSNKLTEDGIRFWSKSISEAYHKAKEDGSNPELVKAVEELLGKPTEQPKETIPNVESKKADIPLGKVGNTEYEVKSDGVEVSICDRCKRTYLPSYVANNLHIILNTVRNEGIHIPYL